MAHRHRLGEIVIATRNPHKVAEIKKIMGDIDVVWRSGLDVPVERVEEIGETYRANAELKAMAYHQASGLPALADDSGLEVDYLNGLPGVRSNRLFGESISDAEKVHRLLQRMVNAPSDRRTARFVCCAVLVVNGRLALSVQGTVSGCILESPAGTGGFGYDPVFWVPEYGATFAEISEDSKDRISHRGRAMRQVRDFLLRKADQSW